jgi:GNAT superfamily N-acetyltransferase
MIRGFREGDEASVDALLRAAWPDDPALREISTIHGPDMDLDGGSRRTRVYEEAAAVVGAGSLLGSARHPTRLFLVVAVAPDRRRNGVGSALLGELRRLADRPLLARARESDQATVAFLHAHGFGLLMRSRTGVVDPTDPVVAAWIARQPTMVLAGGASREEVARAHEAAYRWEHKPWSPATTRPLEESLRLFCGESWLRESALLARGGGTATGVASLQGPPLASSSSELFLIAGTSSRDAATLRALVAAELAFARTREARVSIEADEANAELWKILDELPAALEPDLLLLSTDAGRSDT